MATPALPIGAGAFGYLIAVGLSFISTDLSLLFFVALPLYYALN